MIFRLLILALTIFLTPVIAEEGMPRKESLAAKKFLVKSVEGKVLAWYPWGSKWRQVTAKSNLWESTLLQVKDGGSITLRMQSRENFHDLRGDSLEMNLTRPVVLRLSEDVLRKVKLNSYFIPQIPQKVENPEVAGEFMFRALQEAWERFAAMVSKQGVDLSWLQQVKTSDNEASVALKARRIRIITPRDGLTNVTDRLPVEVRLQWHPVPDPTALYEVRVWKLEEQKSTPLAYTRLDSYNIKLRSEGGFFVQVATADGRWQSGVNRVFVALPVAGRMDAKKIAYGNTNAPLPLDLPPKDFRYFTKALPTWVSFQWDSVKPAIPGQKYELYIMDHTGRELLKKPVATETIKVKFNHAGAYKWKVVAIIPPKFMGEEPKRHNSEVRSFDLALTRSVTYNTAKPDNNPIAQMILNGRSGTLYLDDGFF